MYLLHAWTTSTVLKSTIIPVLAGIVLSILLFQSNRIHFAMMAQNATYFATNCYLFCRHNACCQQVPIMPVIMPLKPSHGACNSNMCLSRFRLMHAYSVGAAGLGTTSIKGLQVNNNFLRTYPPILKYQYNIM